MAARPARPQSLTLTCIFVGVGCTLLFFELVSALSSWGSIELQEAVQDALAAEPLKESGIGVDAALRWLRYLAYAGVVLTTSGAVFALYTARGHRTSRVMLSILCGLAVAAFASLGVAGFLPAIFAALCGWSLWSPDARRWFDEIDGRARSAAAGPDPARADPFAPSATSTGSAESTPSGAHESRVVPPATTDPSTTDAPAAPAGAVPGPAVPGTPSTARPTSVTVAVATTAVSCIVVGFFGFVTLLVSTVGADAYRSALEQPGIAQDVLRASGASPEDVVGLLRVSSAVWLGLSVAGLLAAVATSKRRAAGELGLRIVTVLTVGVSVFFVPVGIVTAVAAVVVMVQLRRPESRAWFARA